MNGGSFLTAAIAGDPEISALFGDAALTSAMLRFEAALARVEAELGIVSEGAAREIEARVADAEIDPAELAEGVSSAGVPVPALLKAFGASLTDAGETALHWGATSQDAVDTGLVLQYQAALGLIEMRLKGLLDDLGTASTRFSDMPMLARTRGQLATPVTFGLRVALWAQPLIGLETELPALKARALRVQFAGASGSRNVVAPHGGAVAEGLARELGLAEAPPWCVDRLGVGALAEWLSKLAAALGKMGRDVVLMSRGEIGELRAGEGGGSSAMPHKSNPVTAEALQTTALLAQGHAATLASSAMHNEDRDGAMWAVEWSVMPALFEVVGAALRHGARISGDLRPDGARMKARLDETPAVKAEAAVFALAPAIGKTQAKEEVTRVLREGGALGDLLACHGLHGALSFEASIAAARETAEAVFARRR